MVDLPDAILLRSADPPDGYLAAFDEVGLRAVCEPVLSFAFPRQDAFTDRLTRRADYEGVVATSPRVAAALGRAFEEQEALAQAWRGAPVYAVGPKTAGRIRDVGLDPKGADAGSADALAARIIDDAPTAPLLFLCGNRRRDTIPRRLRDADIPFEEMVVYETHPRTDLTLPSSDGSAWLVFFSPSGIDAVEASGTVALDTYRLAAIGPTTGGALEDAGHGVEAVADTPSPDGLVSAIYEETEG